MKILSIVVAQKKSPEASGIGEMKIFLELEPSEMDGTSAIIDFDEVSKRLRKINRIVGGKDLANNLYTNNPSLLAKSCLSDVEIGLVACYLKKREKGGFTKGILRPEIKKVSCSSLAIPTLFKVEKSDIEAIPMLILTFKFFTPITYGQAPAEVKSYVQAFESEGISHTNGVYA